MAVLDAAEANYEAVLKAIDDVLSRPTPSKADITFIGTHLAPGVTAIAHIFGTLHADWLTHLRSQGVFSEPPSIKRHEDGSISFPEWPQGRYLARIAGARPTEVADIIEPLSTVDNEAVHISFLRAAAAMPPREARRIALRETGWLASHADWIHDLLPTTVLTLVLHLVSQAEFEAAVALLRTTLTFERDVNRGGSPQPRIPPWAFDRIVHEGVRALRHRAPDVAKNLLVSLLASGDCTRSSMWRQAVEDHRQNMVQEPLDTLFVELRDLYEDSISAHGQAALRQAVTELEASGEPLFARLSLHLLRRHGRETRDLVVERACDPHRLGSTELFHELAAMIEDQFPQLDATSQGKVIEALRRLSSEEYIASRLGGRGGREATEIAASQRKRWFALLGASRPVDVEAEYRALCAGTGEPEHPTFLYWSEVRTGPNPPRTASQLASLSDVELLDYLRDWVPTSSDPFESSYTGLGREIKSCATSDPVRFSRLSRSFRGLNPSYVTGLLWGIHEGKRIAHSRPISGEELVGAPFDWNAVLDLVEWTIPQKDSEGERTDQGAGEWTSARKFALEVLDDMFFLGSDNSERRARIWISVKNLLGDPDPSARRIEMNEMAEDSFVVNTVRGSALRTSLAMTSRLRQHSEDPALLDEMIDEIGRRADSKIEPSYAIRAVRARFFNTLFWLDRNRALATAKELFPAAREASAERRKSWATFLNNNGPTVDVFEGLNEPYYRVAVDMVHETHAEAVTDLGEHLAMLAAWGALDLNAPDNLLSRYVGQVPAAIRREVLIAVGRRLHRTTEPLSQNRVNRFKTLWAWWNKQAAPANEHAEELAAFGSWFSSKIFDVEWCMAVLTQTMDRTRGAMDWDYAVLEKLAALAGSNPQEVATCLGVLVKTGTDRRINLCHSFIRAALVTLRERGIASAATIASRLVARGWLEFRDLT